MFAERCRRKELALFAILTEVEWSQLQLQQECMCISSLASISRLASAVSGQSSGGQHLSPLPLGGGWYKVQLAIKVSFFVQVKQSFLALSLRATCFYRRDTCGIEIELCFWGPAKNTKKKATKATESIRAGPYQQQQSNRSAQQHD